MRRRGRAEGGRRQPKAFVSVVLKARERQRRLQISIRNPLKLFTNSLGYSCVEPGGGLVIVASKARL